MIAGKNAYLTSLYGASATALLHPRSDGMIDLTDSGQIAFDGHILTNLMCVNIFHPDETANREVSRFDVPRRSGRSILSDFRRQKGISLRGHVSADTKELLDLKIRTIKSYLRKKESWFQYFDGGKEVVAKATWENGDAFNREEHWKNTFANVSLDFMVADPCFVMDKKALSVSYFDTEALVFNEEFITEGNVDEMLPVFIFVFSSISNPVKITIENLTTDELIEVSISSVVAGDVLKFDSNTYEVRLNGGDPLDYEGFPLQFFEGANSFRVTVDADSVKYDLTVKNKNYYL